MYTVSSIYVCTRFTRLLQHFFQQYIKNRKKSKR